MGLQVSKVVSRRHAYGQVNRGRDDLRAPRRQPELGRGETEPLRAGLKLTLVLVESNGHAVIGRFGTGIKDSNGWQFVDTAGPQLFGDVNSAGTDTNTNGGQSRSRYEQHQQSHQKQPHRLM